MLVSIAAGCSGGPSPQGGERQPCFPNGTCNVGLICASGVCVDLGGGGTGGTPAGGSGGAGGTMGAAGTKGAAGGAGTMATAGTTGVGGTGGTAGTTGVGGIIGTAGSSGRGGVSGQGGGTFCGSVNQPALRLPPDILLLQDASGSMNQDITNTTCGTPGCGASSKWALMTPAIMQVVAETESQVNWGLKLFADLNNACGVSPNVAVGIARPNLGAIANALNVRTAADGSLTNGSQTPTRAAEDAAVTYLTGLTDTNPKFIVLATDGLPNCPASGNAANDDTPGAIAAVAAARSAGIPTFVVGISTAGSAAESALDMMAVAGGYPRAGTPQYYPVTSTAEFVAVLRTLVGMAGTCTFAVPPPPSGDGTTSRANIAVTVGVGGTVTELPFDATNGWTYTDSTMASIVLHGPACDQVKAGNGLERHDRLPLPHPVASLPDRSATRVCSRVIVVR